MSASNKILSGRKKKNMRDIVLKKYCLTEHNKCGKVFQTDQFGVNGMNQD